ncbi:hypothetical protein [Prosthecobacter sp.]|uniref:hypothetical protein n=1 Tax=Prosthecobacter sp. TaxID=1965333 RepID=UPI0024879536|nr:hypothetical protein [Prosthecobacter sp.]MDI1315141.1 hypothetical protein [Prosthecobacter sp.]
MNTNPELQTISSAARNCAMLMMSYATLIQNELPSIEVPPELLPKIEAVCDSLISTKFDIVTEEFEFQELLAERASPARLTAKIKMMVEWLNEPIDEMREVVVLLQKASAADEQYNSVFFLLAESLVNLVKALEETRSNTSLAAETSP